MTRGFKPQMVPWTLGDDIEIGHVENFQTQWKKATVSKLNPFSVVLNETGEEKILSMNTLRRRPEKKLDEPRDKKELPAEVTSELYHKALVEIIKEGTTKTPNATVRRLINIAKEALGEVPI